MTVNRREHPKCIWLCMIATLRVQSSPAGDMYRIGFVLWCYVIWRTLSHLYLCHSRRRRDWPRRLWTRWATKSDTLFFVFDHNLFFLSHCYTFCTSGNKNQLCSLGKSVETILVLFLGGNTVQTVFFTLRHVNLINMYREHIQTAQKINCAETVPNHWRNDRSMIEGIDKVVRDYYFKITEWYTPERERWRIYCRRHQSGP